MPVFIFFLFVIITWLLYLLFSKMTRQNEGAPTPLPPGEYSALDLINAADYRQRPLFYTPRANLYQLIKTIFIEEQGASESPFLLFSKVSLGELITTESRAAEEILAPLYVDYCITDRDFKPLLILEYYDAEHYKKANHREIDAVKKLAIERAAILFFTLDYREAERAETLLRDRLLPLIKGGKA